VKTVKNKVLILAPHTDDGEFGCGGTIAKFLEEGRKVYYVAFSTCRASVPDGQPEDILKIELMKSMGIYKIPADQVIVLDYPVRNFNSFRQNILDDMIRIGNNIEPDLVLVPSVQDIHQDHNTIAKEAMRAFKKTSLLGYELPWNNFSFNNQTYVVLEEKHILKKIEAISQYKSQNKRDYSDPDFTRGLARAHGVQIGKKYAEVFETIRWQI